MNKTSLLALLLFVCISNCYTNITRYIGCPSSGQSLITIVRDSTIQGRYSLIKSTFIYNKYPYLNDYFKLNIAQRVKISYRVSFWMNGAGLFWTKLTINGKDYKQFDYLSTGAYQRTLSSWDDVWLQKGEYEVAVLYTSGGDVINVPANDQYEATGLQYGRLRIEYQDYQP